MNTIWSDYIQSAEVLDATRMIRFPDRMRSYLCTLWGIEKGITIADIGCGPGTLSGTLARWTDDQSRIIGIDRDSSFIHYATEKYGSHTTTFIEGDALALPLEPNSVDMCMSHTVIEHVPNREFLAEQMRVCKDGGRIVVMWARPDRYIHSEPLYTITPTEEEAYLTEKIMHGVKNCDAEYNVGAYWPDPAKLPALMHEMGLQEVSVDAFAVTVAKDDTRLTSDMQRAILDAEQRQTLSALESASVITSTLLNDEEMCRLKELVTTRFAARAEYLKRGVTLWDYSIYLTQCVSGVVRK